MLWTGVEKSSSFNLLYGNLVYSWPDEMKLDGFIYYPSFLDIRNTKKRILRKIISNFDEGLLIS